MGAKNVRASLSPLLAEVEVTLDNEAYEELTLVSGYVCNTLDCFQLVKIVGPNFGQNVNGPRSKLWALRNRSP